LFNVLKICVTPNGLHIPSLARGILLHPSSNQALLYAKIPISAESLKRSPLILSASVKPWKCKARSFLKCAEMYDQYYIIDFEEAARKSVPS